MLNAIVTSSKTNCCKISLLYAPTYTERSIQVREHNSLDLVFNLILSLSRAHSVFALFVSVGRRHVLSYHVPCVSIGFYNKLVYFSFSPVDLAPCFRDAFVRRCWG